MQHHTTNAEPSRAEQEKQADIAARIGDGSQLTAEDFPHLTYAERVQLHTVNPDAYDALAAGRTPGEKWRPSRNNGTPRAMGADL
jgi:hypothetical protein